MVVKNIGHHACLREKEHLFRYQAYFEGNLLRFVQAHTHVCALITRISCAVGMRNAKLRYHLKGAVSPNLVLLKNPMKVLVLIGNPLVVA